MRKVRTAAHVISATTGRERERRAERRRAGSVRASDGFGSRNEKRPRCQVTCTLPTPAGGTQGGGKGEQRAGWGIGTNYIYGGQVAGSVSSRYIYTRRARRGRVSLPARQFRNAAHRLLYARRATQSPNGKKSARPSALPRLRHEELGQARTY